MEFKNVFLALPQDLHLLMYLLSPFLETACGKTSRGMCHCGTVEALHGFCMYVNPLTGAAQLMDPLGLPEGHLSQSGVA